MTGAKRVRKLCQQATDEQMKCDGGPMARRGCCWVVSLSEPGSQGLRMLSACRKHPGTFMACLGAGQVSRGERSWPRSASLAGDEAGSAEAAQLYIIGSVSGCVQRRRISPMSWRCLVTARCRSSKRCAAGLSLLRSHGYPGRSGGRA